MADLKEFTCLICGKGKEKVPPKQVNWKCPKCSCEWAFVHFIVPKEWGDPGGKR